MQDVLFIQFLSRSKRDYYDLTNGFSDNYDFCCSKGDFYWVLHEPESAKWYAEQTYADRELPITKGRAYVSAAYINHLYQAYIWAQQYPDIHFVVGGPVAAQRSAPGAPWQPLYFGLRPGYSFPDNLEISGRSLEDLFGLPDFSGEWKLHVPKHLVAPESPIYFSYTLDNGCYWGKCIYCNIKEAPTEFFRQRKSLDYEFSGLDHPGHKIVRLNTGSITPAYIREVFSSLPNRKDLEYRTFMRSARAENKALQQVLEQRGPDFPNLTIGIGLEFPSQRMLEYMSKGISTEDILETLEICAAYGVQVNGNVILGWQNLLQNDIQELEMFLQRMPAHSMSTAQLRWLFLHPHLRLHEEYQGQPIYLGPFYLGFEAEIGADQLRLNQDALQLVKDFSYEKHFRIEGLGNVQG